MWLGTQPLLGTRCSCQILAQRDVISPVDHRNVVQSIQEILALPDETRFSLDMIIKRRARRICMGNNCWRTKGKEHSHWRSASEEEFTTMRDERDATLAMPKLIIPSLQVNMRANNMPEPDDNEDVYLKVPVNKL